ncbi:MAG: hypothetical protein WBQ44_17145 [Rhodococcus sp. (in: high G+C Gram-positive bacteria)]
MHSNTHTAHVHHWSTASRHATSQGTVIYQHCTCGAQRVLTSAAWEPMPVAVVDAHSGHHP